MADDKSTPLANLNNKSDDSKVVNDILSKYNTLSESPDGTIPPADSNIPNMEKEFEDRNMNEQLYNLNSDNTQFKDHSESEKRRIQTMNNVDQDDEYYTDEEDYDEYEIEELPLWKKIINEVRIPLFIMLMIVVFMSALNDKVIIKKFPFLGDQFNEINTKGFLLKALICSIVAYLLIRFIRV